MNHCDKPECPGAQELREALAEETISPLVVREFERDAYRAARIAAVWEKLFSQILRVPS